MAKTEQRNILLSVLSRALAEGLAAIGHPAEATMVIDAVVEGAERGSGTFELPDLLRVRAAVQLAASPENWRAAEASLVASLESARQQAAPGWELRTAIALARLWANCDRAGEARTLLADVLAQFTEGFSTTDLRRDRAIAPCAWRSGRCISGRSAR